LATRKGTKRPMGDIWQLKILKLTLNPLFDLIKALVVKALQGGGILFDFSHIITHSSWVGLKNMTKLWILGQTRQDILQHRHATSVMVLLGSRHHGGAFFVDDITREIFVRASKDSKKRGFADAVTANHTNLLAVIDTKFNPSH